MTAQLASAAAAERQAWLRALSRTACYARGEGRTLSAMVFEAAARAPDRLALRDDDGELSYAGLAARIRGYARWTRRCGARAGGTVAMLLPNSADYVALWLGIGAAGGAASLLNTGIAGDALLHALEACGARHLVVGAPFSAAVASVAHRLPAGLTVWGHGGGAPGERMDAALDVSPPAGSECFEPGLGDVALYIYTSGTTGLPKAARVSQRRVAEWSGWFAGMIDTGPDDRMYNCLPLFHSTGGVVAVGAMLAGGGSVWIRNRFSASRFWNEVRAGGCTLFQYIGELCRYLADAPEQPGEAAHGLRLACGNGLRDDVWERFQSRFRIPQILEFYAATEGNVSLYNVPGRVGAIGHVPAFLAHRAPLLLARCDPATRELARDAAGLCIACGPEEPGEALGRIGGGDDAGRPFEGYSDGKASEAKIARGVQAAGDAWFRTGDLMRRDREGYYFFVERLGDTYRWKGENVSTAEVTACLLACSDVRQGVAYGVAVRGTEGGAGMAALVTAADFDMVRFRKEIATKLPEYARPVFLRLVSGLATTATFKPVVAALAAEGFDPGGIADRVYVEVRSEGAYRRLDDALRKQIERGELRF